MFRKSVYLLDITLVGLNTHFFSGEFHLPAPVMSAAPLAGTVGSEVTLNGTDFLGGRGTSRVMFGTTQATNYTAWSDTQVRL